jgi:metal transporter CNNM
MTYGIILALLALSALFSGLTLGLMGLDVHTLKRKARLGNLDAARVYPIRKNGNQLLITLIIGNVAVNASLSVFLGSLASGFTAGITATVLIVVFG